MNYCATNNDAIVMVKRSKIIDLLDELIKTKIHHLQHESNNENREIILNKILELINLLEEV